MVKLLGSLSVATISTGLYYRKWMNFGNQFQFMIPVSQDTILFEVAYTTIGLHSERLNLSER